MNTYQQAMRERACTSLSHGEPTEAETVTNGTLTYLVLRCPRCKRPTGMRLVRKAQVTS